LDIGWLAGEEWITIWNSVCPAGTVTALAKLSQFRFRCEKELKQFTCFTLWISNAGWLNRVFVHTVKVLHRTLYPGGIFHSSRKLGQYLSRITLCERDIHAKFPLDSTFTDFIQ
jgi:hypothetical protein